MAESRDEYIWRNSEFDYSADVVSFSLVDESTVARRQREGDISLPAKKIDVPKDMRWNTKQMNSKLLAGILNGDSIPKIAHSLTDVIGNNKASAVRNARTMVTQAECGGRQDSYENLAAQGVVQKKVWIATPDDRTRESHIEIDGEEVDIDADFSNGLEYPADPSGEPEEVWNCRCSMRTHIVGFRRADGTIAKVDYERNDTMHDKQMAAQKAERAAEDKKPQAQAPAEKPHGDAMSYNDLMTAAKINRIEHNAVKDMEKIPTEQQIIEKLAGADKTKGSCASLALSYCANTVGLDVTDFRGGNSQGMFSRDPNIRRMCMVANADLQTKFVAKEARDAVKILESLPDGKEYLFAAGRHAAIVKNDGGVLKYLEMQSSGDNGWMPFERTFKNIYNDKEITLSAEETLRNRFGCRKTVGGQCFYASVDSFQNTSEFADALGYINTATDKQQKGAGGGAK